MAESVDRLSRLANTGTVLSIFEELRRQRPRVNSFEDFEGRPVSRSELSERADAVVSVLRSAGLRPGEVVAVVDPGGLELAAAIIGIWRSGAIYLPMSSAEPQHRAEEKLRYAQLVVEYRDDSFLASRLNGPAAGGGLAGSDAAYLFFTSGTTGFPKPILGSHSALAHCITAFAGILGVSSESRIAWLTEATFDPSLLEIGLALISDACTIRPGERTLRNPKRLVNWLTAERITHVHATPSRWRNLLPFLAPASLRSADVLSSSEALSVSLARELAARSKRLWNLYGPTEATIWATAGLVRPGDQDYVSVGLPLSHMEVDVRDPAGNPLPVGQVGEVHLTSHALALGYYQDEAATAERFSVLADGRRSYRTGDKGSFLGDGRLLIHGRADRQVKVEGYRVELDDIEAVSRRYSDVAAVYAFVYRVAPERQAVGLFVSFKPSSAGSADGLRAHLAQFFPRPVVPVLIEVMDEIPVTAHGKLDRVALAARARSRGCH